MSYSKAKQTIIILQSFTTRYFPARSSNYIAPSLKFTLNYNGIINNRVKTAQLTQFVCYQ